MATTVNTDVITYLQYINCGTFGTDLFFGRVPDSKKTPVEIWWVLPSQIRPGDHCVSGEDTIEYQFDVYYRSMSLQKVEGEIFRMTKEIVGSHCYELDNFHTIDVALTSTSKRLEMDAEGRVVGGLCFTVTVYNILDPKTSE